MIRFTHHLAIPVMLCMLATTAFAQTPPPTAFRHEIKPGKIEEECRTLDTGARVAYRYVTSSPVAFNVHFHKGNVVWYPVKVERSTGEDGTFTAPSSEEYCWMWTNPGNSNVTVEGSLTTLR